MWDSWAVSEADERANDVMILGAGFSRAISDAMPLTDELGQEAVRRAGLDPDDPRLPSRGFDGGNFETWLSRLAEDQPHLLAADNLERRALFSRVSHAIHAVLMERQSIALSCDAPSWLYELLSVLHVRRTTVITLNYDHLIECGVDTHRLVGFGAQGPELVRTYDVLNDMPPFPPSPARFGSQVKPTLRLLKLHGSLSWYWSEGDDTGATVQRWATPGQFGAPKAEDIDARRRSLPGREPFVIPPSTTKSRFYRNLITRELWQQAYEALRTAKRLVLIGYSLPPADLTIAGLIEDAVRGRALPVTVVNPDPRPVRRQLLALGIPSTDIECIDGRRCVADFSACYANLQAGAALRLLKSAALLREPGLLLLGWSPNIDFQLGGLQPVGSIDPPNASGDVLLRASTGPDPVQPDPTLIPLLVERATVGSRLVAEAKDGRRMPVIDLWSRPAAAPGELLRLTLVPAGRPGTLR